MADKKRAKREKKEKSSSPEIKISPADILRAKLPTPLEAKCSPLLHIGLVFLVVALVQAFVSSMRTMAPFSLLIGLGLVILAFIRKRDMLLTGYDEYIFRTIDYTYLVKHQRRPTGIVLLGEEGPVESEIYHVAVENPSNIPPLNCKLKVYVPKNATQGIYASRKYFSRVYAYTVEEWDL